MAYTDYCIRSGGSNLNSGTRTGNTTVPGTAADFTYASGNLVSATGVFTVASGDPAADGVAVGDFASVYADGATVAALIGKITARDATTITISTTIKMGTMPTDGTGNRTVKIGGAWEGPSGTVQFPFDILNIAAVATANDVVCVNVKSDVTASMTASIACATAGPYQVSGFASTYRDEAGKWTISGPTTGASYVPLDVSGIRAHWTDMVVINNGATGTANGIASSGGRCLMERVSVRSMRGTGIAATSGLLAIECEASDCNTSGTSNLGGFSTSNNASFVRCYSHNNTGASTNGFSITGSSVAVSLYGCVADTNGKAGVAVTGGAAVAIVGCDLYNNVSGISAETASFIEVNNTNFVLNSSYGVRLTAQAAVMLHNCGFPAAGTAANGTDTSSTAGVIDNVDPITITANTTPWNAPSTGDFRITATGNKGTGRGLFTQLYDSKTGLVAYPDVGAGQVSSAAGGGSGGAVTLINGGLVG